MAVDDDELTPEEREAQRLRLQGITPDLGPEGLDRTPIPGENRNAPATTRRPPAPDFLSPLRGQPSFGELDTSGAASSTAPPPFAQPQTKSAIVPPMSEEQGLPPAIAKTVRPPAARRSATMAGGSPAPLLDEDLYRQQTGLSAIAPPALAKGDGAPMPAGFPPTNPFPARVPQPAQPAEAALGPEHNFATVGIQDRPDLPLATIPPPVNPHQQELERLFGSQAGVHQIHNPFLRGLANVGDVLGSALAPGIAAAIPGTTAHRERLIGQQEGYLNQDVKREQEAAQTAAEQAGTKATEAEVPLREAQTEEAQARTESLRNPKPTRPENLAQEHSDAVMDSISRGQDPANDPKVQQIEAAMLREKPEKADTSTQLKEKFMESIGKVAAEGLPTDMRSLEGSIAKSKSLTPEERNAARAYMAANTTPSTQLTITDARVAPQWQRNQIQQTALDLRIAKETGQLPTTDIIQRSQFSRELLPHMPVIRQEIEEADRRGLLGPLIGRGTEFMAGGLGSTGNPDTDKFYAKLRSDLHLLSSGLNRAHFGGRAGVETLKYFDDLVGGSFRSKAMLNGTLDAAGDYLHTYAGATQFGQPNTEFNYNPTATQPIGGGDLPVGTRVNHADGSKWEYQGGGKGDIKNYKQVSPPRAQ